MSGRFHPFRWTLGSLAAFSKFDPGFYSKEGCISGGSKWTLYRHYLRSGWKEDLNPNAWFLGDRYIAKYQDVAHEGLNPWLHFMRHGVHEGRTWVPEVQDIRDLSLGPLALNESIETEAKTLVNSEHFASRNPQPWQRQSRRLSQRRGTPFLDPIVLMERLFDEPFYVANYPDVAATGFNSFTHFLEHGFREGRDPNPWFSTDFYFKANPDILSAGINPFLHFLSTGRKEGRLPRDPLGEWRTLVSSMPNIIEQGLLWPRVLTSSILSIDALVREISTEMQRGGYGSLGLIVGNDDYLKNSGGIQACISVDVLERGANRRATLYLWPAQPLPHLATDGEPHVNLRLNGRSMGATTMPELSQALNAIGGSCEVESDLTVHGLMGHRPESLVALVQDSENSIDGVLFWAHDYFAACSCYTLAPYANEFCGAPNSDSIQCRVCPSGVGRTSHLASIRELLDLPNTLVIAPSTVSEVVFRRATGWSGPTRVKPLGEFEWLGFRRELTSSDTPIRIAFVGYPSPRKGWIDFIDLVRWCAGRSDVAFYHFGSNDQKVPLVSFVPVTQLGGETNAMTEALRDHGIDVALHWPTWPETFGITAHEALAAGCLVLTNNVSGNIVALGQNHEHVLTLDSSTLTWMIRRGLIVPWLRKKRKAPARWGQFVLRGIAEVREFRVKIS